MLDRSTFNASLAAPTGPIVPGSALWHPAAPVFRRPPAGVGRPDVVAGLGPVIIAPAERADGISAHAAPGPLEPAQSPATAETLPPIDEVLRGQREPLTDRDSQPAALNVRVRYRPNRPLTEPSGEIPSGP